MRQLFALFTALSIAGTAYSQLNILSTSNSISASGMAYIHQYASNSYAYSATNGTVGSSIFLSDPNP
ncbi:MAG TPA: hypothetical protein VFC07_01490, partial [Verrucomicrobiae bacterium]|nr:hypothetical protein [Verrucomicrobiae bacterium]